MSRRERGQAKGILIGAILFLVTVVLSGCNLIKPDHNLFRYTDEVTHKSVDGILSALDAAEVEIEEGETFTLVITSPGGSVGAFDSVLHRMNSTKLKTITKIRSYAASAGAMMFALGDERIMEEKAEVMFHYARFIVMGHHITQPILEQYVFGNKAELNPEILKILDSFGIDRVLRYLDGMTEVNNHIRAILEAKFPKKVVDKLLIFGKDVWLKADEALELGVATSIYRGPIARKY